MKNYSKIFIGDKLKWIKNLLDNRNQSVVTNGFNSGTIPGPVLFLACINDLPEHLRSRVRIFADDTDMYLCISNISEANILHRKYIGTHIENITKRANQALEFLKGNIKVHNQDLKLAAYKTLILLQLEYASTVWSPHTASDIYKLESVQFMAAWWATRDYRQTSSVTTMLGMGAQWLSGRVLDSRPRGRGFEPHQRHCVVVLEQDTFILA